MARWDDEILSDNTHIEYCKQCKDCIYWNGEDNFSNRYDKSSCAVYPFPASKPPYVINNRGDCPYKAKAGDGGGVSEP